MPKKVTTEEFIEKAKLIHGDKYDYSLVDYKNNRTKVKIICPKHGIFEQTPGNHIFQSTDCPKCIGNILKTTEEFIEKAKLIHGDKYDYSLTHYVNSKIKVKIICPIHGEFSQTPNAHLRSQGCPSCKKSKPKNNFLQLIEKFKKIHNDKYLYSEAEYLGMDDKIKIICPKHGEFSQTPNNHSQGKGCPKCSNNFSKGEKEVLEYIKSIYSGLILENTRDIIKPYELDIYLPDLNLAIEYNGEYWHNKREKEKPGYHQLKEKLCQENGITLINVSDKDWTRNKNKIKITLKLFL